MTSNRVKVFSVQIPNISLSFLFEAWFSHSSSYIKQTEYAKSYICCQTDTNWNTFLICQSHSLFIPYFPSSILYLPTLFMMQTNKFYAVEEMKGVKWRTELRTNGIEKETTWCWQRRQMHENKSFNRRWSNLFIKPGKGRNWEERRGRDTWTFFPSPSSTWNSSLVKVFLINMKKKFLRGKRNFLSQEVKEVTYFKHQVCNKISSTKSNSNRLLCSCSSAKSNSVRSREESYRE